MSITIATLQQDGFQKVCGVTPWVYKSHGLPEWRKAGYKWLYTNIDQATLYSDHCSWVYAIVANGIVNKIGETGLPLGIRTQVHPQPVANTKNRFGRLANHCDGSREDTDEVIRRRLDAQTVAGQVTLWAKRCPIIMDQTLIGGKSVNIETTIHKSLEKKYLDFIVESTGNLPLLNKARA